LGREGTSAVRWAPGGRGIATGLAALSLVAGTAGCGSGERQDADEESADFPVDARARFALEQRLAETADFQLEVENVGQETIPDLAVTVFVDNGADGPFSVRLEQPNVSDPNRPVWILEEGYPKVLTPGTDRKDLDDEPPGGATVAQTNTFAFGPVGPGESKTIVWRVTPVRAGTYTVHYELAGSVTGKARAVTPDGKPFEGQRVVTISDKPPQSRVTDAGEVETVR
jgi:hypothetical protein